MSVRLRALPVAILVPLLHHLSLSFPSMRVRLYAHHSRPQRSLPNSHDSVAQPTLLVRNLPRDKAGSRRQRYDFLAGWGALHAPPRTTSGMPS